MTQREANNGEPPASPNWLETAFIWARRWGRVLWVCRVSVLSVAIGALLFSLAQVRDLFLDFPGVGGFSLNVPSLLATGTIDYLWPIAQAVGFALLVSLIWAMSVYSVARLAVADSAWLRSPYGLSQDDQSFEAARQAFASPAFRTPRLLAVLCFVIPVASAIWTFVDLLWSADRGLTIRAHLNLILSIIAVSGAGALFWVHMGDRQDWRNLALTRWRPHARDPDAARIKKGDQIIAWATFILPAVILCAPWITETLFSRLWLVPVLLGAWVPVLGFLARNSHRTRAPLIIFLVIAIGALDLFLGDDHIVDLVHYSGAPGAGAADPNRQIDLSQAIKAWRNANGCADGDASACPSPIIVATTGGASRAAFFTATSLGLLLDATCPVKGDAGAPLTFQRDASAPCADKPIFAQRLFALSGVSGGAVGSAVFARALVDGRIADGRVASPCKVVLDQTQGAASTFQPTLYFGATQPATWRDCLQAILSQDFLTPVMAGLGFRDVFAFVGGRFPRFWPDRGHELENAIASAYAKFALASDSPDLGMRADFLATAPPQASSNGQPPEWRPLLLLNSTSVETGRRFVFSTLAPTYAPSQFPSLSLDWLANAYDFHATVDSDNGSRDTSLVAAAHNSARFPVISPAGALYPLGGAVKQGIGSPPPASSAATATTALFGRLVDGGYFDNFGALTARDLAVALASEKLHPFIILITNDPGSAPPQDAPALSWALAEPPNPDSVTAPWWRFAPALEAALATRSAHGDYGLQLLRTLIDPTLDQERMPSQASSVTSCFKTTGRTGPLAEPCFTQLAVYAEPSDWGVAARVKDISMSWWASKLVQEYLDEQVASHTARVENKIKPSALEKRHPVLKVAQCRNRLAFYTICNAMFSSPAEAAACRDSINTQTNAGATPLTSC
jgi:hypothetical protein